MRPGTMDKRGPVQRDGAPEKGEKAGAGLCAIWQSVKADAAAVRLLGVAGGPKREGAAHPWDVSAQASHGFSVPWDACGAAWDVSERKMGPKRATWWQKRAFRGLLEMSSLRMRLVSRRF